MLAAPLILRCRHPPIIRMFAPRSLLISSGDGESGFRVCAAQIRCRRRRSRSEREGEVGTVIILRILAPIVAAARRRGCAATAAAAAAAAAATAAAAWRPPLAR